MLRRTYEYGTLSIYPSVIQLWLCVTGCDLHLSSNQNNADLFHLYV
jgi:hypothetical protein